MRKITLLFASLFLCASAWAQTEGYAVTTTQLTSGDLNGKTEATMIAIKNLSATNNYYFVGNTGAAPYSKAEFDANGEAVFVWEPVTEGTPGSYYLKKLDGTYMQATSPKDFGDKATAAVFTTTNPTSTGSGSTNFNGDKDSQAYINGNDDPNLVRFVNGAGTWINVQNGANGTPTYNSGTGGWTIHFVYTVEKRTICNVTYNFKYNGVVIYTQTTEVALGAAYPAFNVSLPFGVTCTTAVPEGTVEEDKTFDIELSIESFPLEYAESYESITTWYHLNIRDVSPTFMYYDASVEYIKATETAVPEEALDAYSWAFIGNPIEGFRIVNKAAGETMVLSAPVAPTENQNAAQLARLVLKDTIVTGNLTWNLKTPSHKDAAAGAFYVEHPTASAYALNRQNYNGTNTVCYWNQRDTGSAIQAIKRDDAARLQALIDKAEEYLGIMDGNTVGYAVIETEDVEAINADIAAAKKVIEDKADYLEALKQLRGTLESASATTIQPETGKYYTIVNAMDETDARHGQLMYVNKDSLMQFRPEHNDSAVFQFVAAGEGKYYLYNVKTKTYLSTANAHGKGQAATKAKTTETAKPVVITNMGRSNVVKIVPDGGAMLHAQASGSQVVAWINESNTGASAWIIVETTYTPTGIEAITTNAETVIYDLSGRRVEKMEKGIYIVNGKKVIK